jgi:hypothetical protein
MPNFEFFPLYIVLLIIDFPGKGAVLGFVRDTAGYCFVPPLRTVELSNIFI